MTKRRMTKARRLRIFDAAKGVCHLCGLQIKLGEKWEAEHLIALACGGTDDDDNLRPAHLDCHAAKTKQDVKDAAKIKRIRARHIGAAETQTKIPSRGFPKPERKQRFVREALPPRQMFRSE